jgi:hypothetical protein
MNMNHAPGCKERTAIFELSAAESGSPGNETGKHDDATIRRLRHIDSTG